MLLIFYTLESRYFFRRFTKDLKPSDISLSFLRGKGELRNLELNSELITDALGLPPWISVNRVFCDSVRVSVPFTDLNKSPILCVSLLPHCLSAWEEVVGRGNEVEERTVMVVV